MRKLRSWAREELARTEHSPQRIMVARGRDESAVVKLADSQGRTRLQLIVNAEGEPRIELLDAES